MHRAADAALTRQVLVAGALAGFVAVLWPEPAFAHGRGADASNYVSEIVSTTPIRGVTWSVHGGDELLAVENFTGRELVVLGYDAEPYLRVGPDGVYENLRSPATYRNRVPEDIAALPDVADPDADPQWRRIADEPAHSWFDHRIHWDGVEPPEEVQAAPGEPVTVREWTVPFEFGNARLPVYGELIWHPGAAVLPPFLVAGVVALAALSGLSSRTPLEPAVGAAVLLAAVSVVNLVHVADALTELPPGRAPDWPGVALTGVAVAVGAVAAVRGRRGDADGHLALEVGALAVFFVEGVAFRDVVRAAYLDTVWPGPVVRFVVALSLIQVVAIFAVSQVARRRTYDG